MRSEIGEERAFLVTGASGFLGKQLVLELLTRHEGGHLWAAVRPTSQPAFREWLTDNRIPRGAVTVVDADVTAESCAIANDVMDAMRQREIEVYHCAAHYDLDDDDEDVNWSTNVHGTANALQLAESLGAVSFNHASTIAVAGNYHGTWTEDHLLEARTWRNNYGRSKHEAEKLVRESSVPRRNIFRFGVLVGDAATGANYKDDGVYSFFTVVKKLVDTVPRAIPLPTFGWGAVPISPIDHAAKSMAALADQPGHGCTVLHVFEDRVLRADQLLQLLFDAAGHSQSVNVSWIGHVVRSFNEQATHDGVLTKLKENILEILAEASVPTALLQELDHPTQYTNGPTSVRLRELGIRSSVLDEYVDRLWHGWLGRTGVETRQRAQSFFRGKRVVLTGGTSGVGRYILWKILELDGSVLVLGRNREKLSEVLSGISASALERVEFIECDLLEMESIVTALAEINTRDLAIDVFIHSAGVSVDRLLLDMSDEFEEVTRMTTVNFLAPLRLVRGFLPRMMGRGESRVVALSSISAQMGIPGFGAYSATKAALDQAFTVLPTELLGSGVSFSTVYLPLVKSPMTNLNIRLRDVPMMSESAAAEMVLTAVIDGKHSGGTQLGSILQGMKLFFPTFAPLLSNLGWKVFLRLPYFSRVIGASLTTKGD